MRGLLDWFRRRAVVARRVERQRMEDQKRHPCHCGHSQFDHYLGTEECFHCYCDRFLAKGTE